VTGEGNRIANNGGDGVLVSGEEGAGLGDENDNNSIRGNTIFSNGGLGIDLDLEDTILSTTGDGITANDAGDGDTGNNELQNFPLVNAALPQSSTFVRGFLNSRPNAAYTIDIYRATTCDPSGNGEGGAYLGSTTATTNAFGNALWSTTVTATVPANEFVTATATDSLGSTSEFSACRQSGTEVPDQAIAPAEEQQVVQTQTQTETPTQQGVQTPQQQGPVCNDKRPPITTLRKAGVKQTAGGTKIVLTGTSADHRECPSGVERVQVSLARVAGPTAVNCRFVKRQNRYSLTGRKNCRRPTLFRATGTNRWTFTFDVDLKPGLYRAQARGIDNARNKETPKKGRNIVPFSSR
jgi:hypothetical protein